ncbi:MAG: hypothetical protein WAU69_15135 [Solirubrobacteraceae bacterium]
MSRKDHVKHISRGATGLIAALSLAACGSSSPPSKTTEPHTSTVAAASTRSSSSTKAHSSDAPATSAAEEQARAGRHTILTMVACLRQHGIHVPQQDLSAPNLRFNSTGIDTSTPAYKNCSQKALAADEAFQKSARSFAP